MFFSELTFEFRVHILRYQIFLLCYLAADLFVVFLQLRLDAFYQSPH